MTTLIPPLNGGYFPPENEDDPYGLNDLPPDQWTIPEEVDEEEW
jgi:hypothetical protein